MQETALRLRAAVGDNFALVVVSLVVLGSLGGYVTYDTYADPATETETRQVSSWESTGEFTHQATVINGSDAFAQGEVLRNRSVYFQKMTPRLNGSFTYGYTATEGGELRTNVTLLLVKRSVEEYRGGNETVYWRVERVLGTTGTRTLAPGEREQIPFSVNITQSKQLADSIEKQVGDTPGNPRIHVLAQVELSGTRNGEPVDATRRYRLPIQFDQAVYQIGDPGPWIHSGRQTEEITVPVQYGPLRRLGGPFLTMVAVGCLLGLVVGYNTDRLAVSETEREWLAYRSDRKEFDDWITTGGMPAKATDTTVVEVDSLSGLVDTAIDTGNRVIEDHRRGQFVVISETITYTYEPPSLPGKGSLQTGLGREHKVDTDPTNGSQSTETATADDR